MESSGQVGSFKVRVDALPNVVRGELVELGVRMDDARELADGWAITVREDRVGATIGLLAASGLHVLGVDPIPPETQGRGPGRSA